MRVINFPIIEEHRAFVTGLIPEIMNLAGKQQFRDTFNNYELSDLFRSPQIDSKASLFQELVELKFQQYSKILVIGGWLGFTSFCLFKLGFFDITEIDIDPRVAEFSKELNKHNVNFKHQTIDCNLIDTSQYDIVINTCCEHIIDNAWYDKITEKTVIFLHSNDLNGFNHVNTCKSLTDMREKYPMSRSWVKTFNYPGWNRFTLTGYK